MEQQLFNKSTGNKLERLFRNLPEVFFWTVISTRFFIMVPLFLAAKIHFDFLHYTVLINITALVSVFIVETILTLPSLSTPFFQRYGLKKYRNIALRSTIAFGLFNQMLIIQAWSDLEMRWQALTFYSFVNVATIVLAEYIGVMIGAKRQVEETEVEEAETEVETAIAAEKETVVTEMPEQAQIRFPEPQENYSRDGLPSEVGKILNSGLPQREKGLQLKSLNYSDQAVGDLLGVARTTVYRWQN